MGDENRRDYADLERRHRAFWLCEPTDRPVIVVDYAYYVDTELVAKVMGDGELHPDDIDPHSILPEYDTVAAVRERIGDDMLAAGEPLVGIPWLEAICGCRIEVIDGKSLWPAPPEDCDRIQDIVFSTDNPWYVRLLEIVREIVRYVDGRYAVSMSHLRGPTDVLAALLGTQSFFFAIMDEPERVRRMAEQAADAWLQVAEAQTRIIPAYRGGHVIRQFGLWSPGRSSWLQDDTSSMLSQLQYSQFFIPAFQRMAQLPSVPYGVLHLHIPSLHLAEDFAKVAHVRALNVYFDDNETTVSDALPVLKSLQEAGMPLVLAKTVYEGFTLEEYAEIRSGLSRRGLSVHLKADSEEEACAVMARVREVERQWDDGPVTP